VSVTIRSARPSDAPAIVEFNARLARETEDKQLDPAILATGVAAVLADFSRGRYFVAERDDEVVGQLMITYEWSDWRNGWIWWLQSVYVRADQRGQGIFRSLFEHAVQQARAAGQIVSVRLYVEKNNNAAQAVYRNLGFEDMHFNLMGKTL
jgi:ribosomal protein S18 acetylase RimI-like enzyme